MPIFGWDASHYDGRLTTAILARARAEGVAFFTHKIAEGLGDTEGTLDDTALAAARDAGIEFIGGYLVPRSNASVAAQVDRWIALADAGEPWWRTHAGWFWQIDLERWPYDNVPASVGIACAQEIRRRTGRWTILYASHGQYGDQLAAWDGPLWNADYTSRPAGGIAAMYPGDDWQPLHGTWRGGWAPYSGTAPTILQYTSSATIAGLTTCDANAYRGTLDQLRALITGGTTMAEMVGTESLAGYLMRIERALLWPIPGIAQDVAALRQAVAQVLAAQGATQADIDELLARPAVTLDADQVTQLGADLAAVLVAHPDTPLGEADIPAMTAALDRYFSAHFGQTRTPTQG